MTTSASYEINLVNGRRYIVNNCREYDDCVAVVKENGEYATLWLKYDLKAKYIKCYSGYYPTKVRGLYPMTKAGVKQAYHDAREYARYTKS